MISILPFLYLINMLGELLESARKWPALLCLSSIRPPTIPVCSLRILDQAKLDC